MRYAITLSILFLAATSACTEPDDTPQSLPVSTQNIQDDLNKYATELVASTKNNIFGFTVKEPSPSNMDYLIQFQTSDPNLMSDITGDEDKNPAGYARNIAITTGWGVKFCTQELKSIMTKYGITYVDGMLLDAKTKSTQSISLCANPSNPSAAENLNNIQNMMEKMDSWK